jgi:hypothetical protein
VKPDKDQHIMAFEQQTTFTPPHPLDKYGPADGKFIMEPKPDPGPAPPKPPVLDKPATVSAADAQIAFMIHDKKFGERLLGGDRAALAEFNAAHEVKENEAGKIDQLLDGNAEFPLFQMGVPGQLPIQAQVAEVDAMRTLGLSDGAIRQAFEGAPVPKAEFEMVRMLKERLLSDKEFIEKFLSGNMEAARQFKLINIVMTNGYVGGERF